MELLTEERLKLDTNGWRMTGLGDTRLGMVGQNRRQWLAENGEKY